VKRAALLFGLVVFVGCASTQPVDLKESRRVVGTENDVRIDAEVFGDRLAPTLSLPIKYDITNHREKTILIADLIPESQYDPESLTVTITIGTEIPGEQFLPRLIPISPGEKKSFQTLAKVVIMSAAGSNPWAPRPNAIRIRVNFLGDPKPFEKLVAIPEKAVHDPQLAEVLFTKWVEGNETVTTNTLPMRWAGAAIELGPTAPARRARRGGGGT
jgi:hypothetical protein